MTGCGGSTQLISGPGPAVGIQSKTPQASRKLGFPTVATKNTTRVGGGDPVADAAGVALAVYPSSGPGTHPAAVTLAPTGSWQAAVASAVLMAAPIKAPILLSGSSVPSATADALKLLAPQGAGAAGGAQVIRIGDAAAPSGLRAATISGKDAYSLAAGIDRFESAARGRTSTNVVVTTADDPGYAMPAAGWAAESGEPVLFVNRSGVPAATRQALLSHQNPRIYVLGPAGAIPDSVLTQLRKYGSSVKRIGGPNPGANSVAFATYRDPPCQFGQPCAHVPGSFGWAMRSPGHGYVLLNSHRPLDAAAAAPLSASGDFGPQLIVDDASRLPSSVLNFFLNYATPGYTQEGPTAAVYNHGWVIGDEQAVSISVQAEVDNLLEAVPQK